MSLAKEVAAAERLDRTARLVLGLRRAWREFNGDLGHSETCGPKNRGLGRLAEPNDPRCDCGLRELWLALEAL